LNEHILPVIGTCEIAAVARKEVEDVVAALDRKVRANEISAKTARNIWGTCTKLFDDATNAKPAAGLRCIAKDPTDGVRGPDDDAPTKLLQFLFPSEFLQFVSCEDVPLTWRRNVSIAIYLCLREGEQRALKWSAIDLEHGIATIAEKFDARAGKDKEGTKNGSARRVPIRSELMPLLVAMHKESGGTGYVCDMTADHGLARGLRRWLVRAGITRPEAAYDDERQQEHPLARHARNRLHIFGGRGAQRDRDPRHRRPRDDAANGHVHAQRGAAPHGSIRRSVSGATGVAAPPPRK
jgi:integrase